MMQLVIPKIHSEHSALLVAQDLPQLGQPILGLYHTHNYIIFHSSVPGRGRWNTNLKGELPELLAAVGPEITVLDISQVDARVMCSNVPREYDSQAGNCSLDQYIKILITNGATKIQ